MKKSILNTIKKHCSADLWALVLNGETAINENNDTWEISGLLNNKRQLLEILKVVCCFERLGGCILYNGQMIEFTMLGNLLSFDENTTIQLFKIKDFWTNNCANGVMPIYDIGGIQVPNILPRFAIEECPKGKFVILKLCKGKYIQLKGEIYSTEKYARQRADELNKDANEDNNIISHL